MQKNPREKYKKGLAWVSQAKTTLRAKWSVSSTDSPHVTKPRFRKSITCKKTLGKLHTLLCSTKAKHAQYFKASTVFVFKLTNVMQKMNVSLLITSIMQ